MASKKHAKPLPYADSHGKKRLVCIRWNDHTSLDDWIAEKEMIDRLGQTAMLSVGWLIAEDADAYYIAGTLDTKNENVGDSRCILKGVVIKVIDIGHE